MSSVSMRLQCCKSRTKRCRSLRAGGGRGGQCALDSLEDWRKGNAPSKALRVPPLSLHLATADECVLAARQDRLLARLAAGAAARKRRAPAAHGAPQAHIDVPDVRRSPWVVLDGLDD